MCVFYVWPIVRGGESRNRRALYFQVGVKFDFSSDLLHVRTYIILHTRTFWGGIPRAPPTQRTQK